MQEDDKGAKVVVKLEFWVGPRAPGPIPEMSEAKQVSWPNHPPKKCDTDI